jgi:formamidopyrimidine-DNA glycosylase
MEISSDRIKKHKDHHLHSPSHVLADELCVRLNDKKHFGFYLKMAVNYDHNILRKIAGEVLEQKAKKPGALFAYLIKKRNLENAKNNKSS